MMFEVNKAKLIVLFATVIIFVGFIAGISSKVSAEIIDFPDADLENALVEADLTDDGNITEENFIDENDDRQISKAETENVTSLALYDKSIDDTTGLEYFIDLYGLYIAENNLDSTDLKDISALDASGTKLEELDLDTCSISDISHLSSLTQLDWIGLYNNNISDLSPLSNITTLTQLYLSANSISDISPLSSLENLSYLNIYNNNISDINPLSSLENLSYLNLFNNSISDISPFSSLDSLEKLYMGSNEIEDISSLKNLVNLTELSLSGNNIKDIRALSQLTNLNKLWLSNNPVFDISANNALHLDNLDFTVSNEGDDDQFKVWVPQGYVRSSSGMTETDLDTASIELEIYPTTFADNTLDESNFSLSNAPVGLSIESVNYINDKKCTVNLAFDDTDFDSDIGNLGISIDGAELAADEYGNTYSSLIFSDDVPTITANNDTEFIIISDDGNLNIGEEDGEKITVDINGGQFETETNLDLTTWTVENLPDGVTADSLERVDDTTVNIVLSGNNSNPQDYKNDITDTTVIVPISQYIDSTGDDSLIVNSGVIFADNTPPVDYSLSIDQDVVNVNNENEISFSIINGETEAEYEFEIDDNNPDTEAVTGIGTMSGETESSTGYDLSHLDDGELSAELTLTDKNGNTGETETEDIPKDTPEMIVEMKGSYETGDSLDPGEKITYKIEIENIGQSNLEASEITAYIPSNTKYVEGSTKVNGTTVNDQNGMTSLMDGYQINTPGAAEGIIKNNDDSTSVKVEYQVEATENTVVGSKIENQVELNGKGKYSGESIETVLSNDPDTEKENDLTISQIGDAALIEVEKTIEDNNDGDVEKGDSLQVKNIVRNRGNKKALSVQLKDLLPENVSFKDAELIINEENTVSKENSGSEDLYAAVKDYFREIMVKSKNYYTVYAQTELPYTINDGEIIVDVGDLEAGEEIEFNYTITINEDTPEGDVISSTSSVSSQATEEIEVTEEVVVGQMPNLKSEINVRDLNGGDIETGDVVEITANIENDGNVGASDLTVSSLIPEELTYIENSTELNGESQTDQINNSDKIEINYGDLEAGEKAEVKYRAEIIDSAEGAVIESVMNYSAVAKAEDTGLTENENISSDVRIGFEVGAAPGSAKIAGQINSSSENIPKDWYLELNSGNSRLGRIQLEESGEFEFSGLAESRDYELLLKHPETEVVYLEKEIPAANLKKHSSFNEGKLFVDPAGIVYNSLTRKAVEGAVLTMVDQNGDPVPDNYLAGGQQNQVTAADGSYEFDLNFAEAAPGEYSIRVKVPSGYLQPESDSNSSTIILKETGPLDPEDNQFEDADPDTAEFEVVDNENNNQPPVTGEDTTYYLDFELDQNTDDIVNNNLPIDPTEASLIRINKKASESQVSVGEFVSYKIEVENNSGSRIEDFRIYDKLPAGFKYIEESAQIKKADSSAKTIKPTGKGLLSWDGLSLNAEESLSLSYTLVVGTGNIKDEKYINKAYVQQSQSLISNTAQASVLVTSDPTFDGSTIVGKVFSDSNQNGVQDAGEKGIAGAEIVSVSGETIKTDEYGRYHLVVEPKSITHTGETLVLKLDKNSLPEDIKISGENPAVIKVKSGTMHKVNFEVINSKKE